MMLYSKNLWHTFKNLLKAHEEQNKAFKISFAIKTLKITKYLKSERLFSNIFFLFETKVKDYLQIRYIQFKRIIVTFRHTLL